MKPNKTSVKPSNVDEYIADFPEETREILERVRAVIKEITPEAEESISYAIPAFKIKGRPLVYFAAFKNHLGFYATPNGNEAFKKELSGYKQGKGSVQFPFDKPIPFDLIAQIVQFNKEKITELTK